MQKTAQKILVVALVSAVIGSASAQEVTGTANRSLLERASATAQEAIASTSSGVAAMLDKGFGFLGIRYRMGGDGPEAGGFDCSGLVKKVFADALGVNLPRTAVEMAQMGDKVGKQDLKPGDLVFFNTLKKTFSHVGIYLGDNKFLHAPSSGGVVRVDDMDSEYWLKHFTGARRLVKDAEASTLVGGDTLPRPR